MSGKPYPPADRQHHRAFCDNEGWEARVSSRGKSGQDHFKYELRLVDGSVLRTRIWHPVDRTTYAPSMWAHILGDQLSVDADVFWACVRDGVLPQRSRPDVVLPSLPVSLVQQLLNAGVAEAEIAKMAVDEAATTMATIWSTPPI
ncbi:MAG: cytotoxic translational repressor of toxin-antitoxin stability system [Cellulomonas sp.]